MTLVNISSVLIRQALGSPSPGKEVQDTGSLESYGTCTCTI